MKRSFLVLLIPTFALAPAATAAAAQAGDVEDAPAGDAAAREAPQACGDEELFHALDFWLGEWDVRADGRAVGRNRIERVLDGCAVVERWEGADGGRGTSLFYPVPATGEWKQVWVTDRATRRGGVKEKRLVERRDDGGLRFQGEIPLEGGGSYLDRTTLTPLADGRVRQVIEVSTDGGGTWRTVFDGVYVSAGPEG